MTLRPGNASSGMLPFLSGNSQSDWHVNTDSPSEILTLDDADFHKWLENDPSLSQVLAKNILLPGTILVDLPAQGHALTEEKPREGEG